jgi:hypothetical protein
MSDGLIRSYIFRRERPFTLPRAFMMHRFKSNGFKLTTLSLAICRALNGTPSFAQTADKEIIQFTALRCSSNASREQT